MILLDHKTNSEFYTDLDALPNARNIWNFVNNTLNSVRQIKNDRTASVARESRKIPEYKNIDIVSYFDVVVIFEVVLFLR